MNPDIIRLVCWLYPPICQALMRVADGCLQMYGGLGFMSEMLISRYYRDARGLAIGGGADEVMRDVIARIEGYYVASRTTYGGR